MDGAYAREMVLWIVSAVVFAGVVLVVTKGGRR